MGIVKEMRGIQDEHRPSGRYTKLAEPKSDGRSMPTMPGEPYLYSTLTKEQAAIAILMVHTDGRQLYHLPEVVEKRKRQGWSVVGGEPETTEKPKRGSMKPRKGKGTTSET